MLSWGFSNRINDNREYLAHSISNIDKIDTGPSDFDLELEGVTFLASYPSDVYVCEEARSTTKSINSFSQLCRLLVGV